MGFLKNLDDWLAKIFTLAIVVITIIAVFMRYILNDPLQWIEEVLIALYLWAIMFGAASAMVAGVVSGACLTALITRTARWEGFDSPGQLARSALGGWLLLHQSLSMREVFGCTLIFAAVVLAQLPVEDWLKCRSASRR